LQLRGVLIGCGYASGHQLTAWANIPDVTIAAVASRTRASAENRAREFAIPEVYPDLPTMLKATEPDFVDIATPPNSHVELVEIAASHGVDILCQKPVAETLEELTHMIEVCEAAGVTFVVNENGRFQPWYRRIYELIHNERRLGELRSVEMESRAALTMPEPDFGDQPFFATMERLILLELGVHHLDTLRYLLGEASTISATTRQVSPLILGEDEAIVVSDHNGVQATVDMSWARPPEGGKVANSESWASVRIEGSTGTLTLGYDGTLAINGTHSASDDWRGTNGEQAGYQAMQQHFVGCLASGIEAETSGRETLKTMELVFGAYRSAETGHTYRVGGDIEALA